MTTSETTRKNNQWIWIGLGAAALFCLCAVGVAALVFLRMGQQFRQGMKTDPQAASKAARAIADYELPPGYQEQFAMDFFVYNMVMIAPQSAQDNPSGKPIIMLAQFKAVGNQQQMEQQIRQSFEQQAGRRGLTMKLVSVKKQTIRGEEVDVATYEGSDQNGVTLRQLVTTFPGKGGTAMLMIMGTTQSWDEDAIDKFIESIH